jgi:GNAT superfamily N-acetyltransferase
MARMSQIQTAAANKALPGTPSSASTEYRLRAHRPGDIGWIVSRHGAIYAQEYGWSQEFEGLVAQIAGQFLQRFDPAHEACWIAEREGRNIGCVVLVQARDDATDKPESGVAQLRLLLVEPSARGLGVGAGLVAECERFARLAGYRRIRLWTQANLVAARAIYRKAGYVLIGSEPHRSFGADLIGENWELAL